jgi:hypothetical protein
MKSFDSRTYSIADFLEWSNNRLLELNPAFQRRLVWTETARSYLMDTIIRGKPIPKFFIRQRTDPSTRSTMREVVDGQQRLHTILAYVKDGFQISPKHNSKFGGRYFSQLDEVEAGTQETLLDYGLSVDLLTGTSDDEVLDIFSRLNSYAVTLNTQERINANHFGPFKLLADQLAHKYYDYWLNNGILTTVQVFRMGDVALVAELLIGMIEGIKSSKQLKYYYDHYEKEFNQSTKELESRFDRVITDIQTIFHDDMRMSEFRRVSLFYSLFLAIYHIDFGLPSVTLRVDAEVLAVPARARNSLEQLENVFASEDKSELTPAERQFVEDSRRATTDAATRLRRAMMILERLSAAVQDA